MSSFLFLAFHWLTFYHMTPFRIKPSLVSTPISEHVSFLTKDLCSKRWNSLRSVTAVINLLTFYLSLSTEYSVLKSLYCCVDNLLNFLA